MGINWKNNKLGIKIFRFGLGMYLIFSILVYFVIYAGIPGLYKSYKQNDFERRVNYVINNSDDITELTTNINILLREAAIGVRYEYQGQQYDCILTDECRQIMKRPELNINKLNDREDYLTRTEVLIFNGKELTINFRLAISSTDEVRNILFMFLPIFGALSVTMAFILAYYISTRLSKSIVKLRNDAQMITSLNFDIEQSVKSDDELGDLSYNLVILANALNKTLSELKEANDKLYDDIEKERIKEEERRAYIATISHDLKTPLTAIKGQLEGMLYNVGKYKDHKTYLENNIVLANEMEKMIQSIIISSKLDDYNTEIYQQKVSLMQCLENSLDKLNYLIEKKELKIEIDIDKKMMINVDVNLFSRVLNNLIDNAVEYANSKSTIIIKEENNILSIENETFDFDDSLISEGLIYKPFYRQDKSRNKNGSGMGMYIVKKICDLHNIDVVLDYENDIFKVSLDLNNN
ncbi:two-component system sensor histidine kinase VanS [Bacilli bacterium PM5-3]|nr:two-component system sensor histidine kinase VanS [Bacilli bacterium PM5-3]MDH6603179.1 two-component system sensor histidine kinase VanS [Bacilli bacterium PM5-9]